MQGANAPSQMKSTKILWPLAILGSPHQGGRTSVVLLKTALSCSRRRPPQEGRERPACEAQPAMSCAHASLPLPLAMSQTSIPCVRTEGGTSLASMSAPARPRSCSMAPSGYGTKPSSGGDSVHSAPKRMQQTSPFPVRAGYKLSAQTSLKIAFQTPFLPNQSVPVRRSDPKPVTSPAAHCSSH